MLFTASI